MKNIFLALTFLIATLPVLGQNPAPEEEPIKVLNFATFHLSNSTDANTSPVDINNPEVQKNVNKVVRELVKFNPTIICVEIPAKDTPGTNRIYQEYKKDQSSTTNWAEEINSIAFEVGRLAVVENIYGIDSPIGFNYPKLMEMAEESDRAEIQLFMAENKQNLKRYTELGFLEKFKFLNSEKWKSNEFNFYNFLATIPTPSNYEGADIIAEFYKRNLRIYSNFVNIPANENDRILIITGGTHTAFLDVFLENNPQYELADPTDYTDY